MTKPKGMTKALIYNIAGISRQGFYQAKARLAHRRVLDESILWQVRNFRKRDTKTGMRIMYHMLDVEAMGINRFEPLVSSHDLNAIVKKKRIVTTKGIRESVDKNLINGYVLNGINQVLIGDITYYGFKGQWRYIITLKDAYSKKILGLGVFKKMTKENTLSVLLEAIEDRGALNLFGTIHHTDAGGQYKSILYKSTLQQLGMRMSIAGNCLENGIAEQLNYIVKEHGLSIFQANSDSGLKRAIKDIKYFLNHTRPIKALGYRTPFEFEQWIKTLNNEQKPKQKLYDFEVEK
jgi:transposase InsO family protein